MSDIKIIDNNTTSNIYLNNNIISGYIYTKDGVLPISEKELNIINSIKLSNNKTKLKSNKEYEIYLDNNSNLLHFFRNGKEDIAKFIKENTFQYILENTNKIKKSNKFLNNEKVYIKLGGVIVGLTIISLIAILGCDIKKNIEFENQINSISLSTENNEYEQYANKEPISEELFSNIILNETSLTDDEKNFLNNSQFINDILPYINETGFKYDIVDRLKGLSIESYNYNERQANGYYIPGSNIIHILNYNKNSNYLINRDVLSHEFCHLFQNNRSCNYLLEGTAEILSNEYFEGALINSYSTCVFNTKLLMEIIGPDLVLSAISSNEFAPIMQELENYLSKDQVNNLFQKIIYTDFDNENINYEELQITSLLLKAYESKYGYKPDEKLLAAMHTSDYHRYYFNTSKRNLDNENYLINNDYICLDLNEALKNDIVTACTYEFENMSYANYLENNPILFEWNISLSYFKPLTPNIVLTKIKLANSIEGGIDLSNSIITYLDNGEEKNNTVQEMVLYGLVDVSIPRNTSKFYSYEQYSELNTEGKVNLTILSENAQKNGELIYIDYFNNKIYLREIENELLDNSDKEISQLNSLPGCEYNHTLKRN